jgi:hypothetical protein
MSKKHKHSEQSAVKSEPGALAVGDYVMLRADGPLTREIMGSSVGLLTALSSSLIDGPPDQGRVLFCGNLFIVKLEHIQLRNY